MQEWLIYWIPALTLFESFWIQAERLSHWSRPWDGLSETILKPRHRLLADHSLLNQALGFPQIWTTWLLQRTILSANFLSAALKLHYLSLALPEFHLKTCRRGRLQTSLPNLGTILCMFPCVSVLGFYREVLVYRLGCMCPCTYYMWGEYSYTRLKLHLNTVSTVCHISIDMFVDLGETWVQKTQSPKLHCNQC